ncbi:MAG: hypothetical protein SVR04_12740, partial [Spirochaetota bacterium]|nr:hypothetical protein [Spirochaetota bacterium]
MAFLLITAGLVTLTVGAELLVKGASGLARSFGIPALIIGLTVVALGTSAPELAVSIKAGLSGQADIALGNVVGSNIFNVLFILGVSALVIPLSVSSQLVRLDVPVMICVSLLAWLFAADGRVIRLEGAVLVVGLIVYTTLLIRIGMKLLPSSNRNPYGSASKTQGRLTVNVVLVLFGLVFLIIGARWHDDIFDVLAAWGPCDDCPEDVNFDGVVDIDDL